MGFASKNGGWAPKGQNLLPLNGTVPDGGTLTFGAGARLILDDGTALLPSLTFKSFGTTGLHASAGPVLNIDASAAVNTAFTAASAAAVQSGRVFQAIGGFRIAGTQTITAVGNTITLTAASGHLFPIDPDATYLLTSAPTIPDGVNGQLAWIINIDTAFTVTIQDQSALANSNVKGRGGANIVLAPSTAVMLVFSTTTSLWHEV